ncbi:sulfatase [Aestuariivivens sediminicola]|uniref:sulfatase n=1 Tax=Aestuariivivens sediminicola TaxID=2913560 RepID=UPI001F599569|nr:sulfatase [Aestuariivivens sediminicola]
MKLRLSLVLVLFFTFKMPYCQTDTMKPNVLLIICDDLNDYQGVFGGHPQARTPHIDKLTNSGVRFLNAQSNIPVCSPSRNSFITGVYPHVSKDYGWTDLKKQPVLKHNKTLMRYFKENGYKTLGSGKITHGSVMEDWDEWGMPLKHNYGPLYFDGEKNNSNPSVPAPFNSIGPIDGSYGRLSSVKSEGIEGKKGWVYGWDKKPMRYISDNDRDLMQDELHAQWAANKILELEKNETEQPFVLAVGFVRPHTPLHAPDKYFDMFPLEDLVLDQWKPDDSDDTFYKANFNTENKDNKGPKYYRMLLESYGGDHETALKHFLQAYLACVAFVDEQIGKVMDALNNSKFKENTIVVLTSDHGWQMGEKEYLFKNSPWEESMRIPLVIKTPDCKENFQVEHPVSLIDLYPTLKDYCNLKGSNKLDDLGGDLGGFSLKPFIDGKEENWKGPKGALSVVGNFGVDIPTEKQNFSYRTQNWRYIRYGNGQEELYDHKNDPYEWENLALNEAFKEVRRRLSHEMDKLINTE